jgi:cytochrome c
VKTSGIFLTAFLFLNAHSTQAQDDAVSRGESVFRSQCSPCHTVENGHDKIGPSLYNLFGTVGGTAPSYNFSSAMREHQILWTDQNINAHTTDPQKFTPGTYMTYPGLKDAKARADLIAYLRKATAVSPTPNIPDDQLVDGVFFYPHISSIIQNYCLECHGHQTILSPKQLNGMLLESYDEVTKVSLGGLFVRPGELENSLFTNFLDGDRHFVSLVDYEKRLVEKWIKSGARRGSGFFGERKLVLEDVDRANLYHIYCHTPREGVFARIDVVDPHSKQVYFTNWLRSASNGWIHWAASPDSFWPDRVDVELALYDIKENGQPANIDDGFVSIFVASQAALDDMVLQKYQEYVSFHNNPINSSTDTTGEFSYLVREKSDVTLRVGRSIQGAAAIFTFQDLHVPPGTQHVKWSFGAAPMEKGEYSARFHFRTVSNAGLQPDYALLISVR